MANDFIPVCEPYVGDEEKARLMECIDTGWISSEGPFVREFESSMAAQTGRKHALAVNSGTMALEIAVRSLDFEPGDEIILPSFTIISCAQAVVQAGLKPVVVDCDAHTWNMTAEAVAAEITPRTKAIMVVHIFGLPVDMEPLLELAKAHNLKIIEDAAEAHGLTYQDRPCGSFGDVSVFSFYANKLVTCGEGGMVLTDDARIADRAASLRNLCFNNTQRFVHDELGYNGRMTNLQAAVGLAQMERLDRALEARRTIGRIYTSLLEDVQWLQLPLTQTEYADNGYWVFGIVLDDDFPCDAREVMARLGREGIGTRPFFWPMHEQPVFRKMGLFHNTMCPVSERIARRGLYLPCGLALSPDELERVARSVKAVAG